jgi:hypothetical protein
LLNRVDSPASLVPSEHIDIRVFEDYGGHGASFLVEFGDLFPTVQVYRVALAEVEDAVDWPTPERVNIVRLMGQRVGVTWLH